MKSATRPRSIWTWPAHLLVPLISLALGLACSSGGGGGSSDPIVVDTLLDNDTAPIDAVTLRDALAEAGGRQSIVFDASLDGGTIAIMGGRLSTRERTSNSMPRICRRA